MGCADSDGSSLQPLTPGLELDQAQGHHQGQAFPMQDLLPSFPNTCSSAFKLPGSYKYNSQPEQIDKQFPDCVFSYPPPVVGHRNAALTEINDD